MGDREAPAWWAGVEHLREGYERRDGARRDREVLAARRAARHREPQRQAPPDRRPSYHRPTPYHPDPTPVAARRTVVITGRTVPAPIAPRAVDADRRRPPRRSAERLGARPDRLAMWALLMGILLILVAVGTADASVAAALPH